MSRAILAILVFVAAFRGWAAEPRIVHPYERAGGAVSTSSIDDLVLAAQRERGVEPANPCSDEVFIRRVYLDVIGTLPEPPVLRDFYADPRPNKRAALIETLFEREEFADYWALKWCDLLRVKAEFPINLWPNAVQAYHRWIRDTIRQNMPYDQFARELLTSSGSNFRVPPVNFYRAVQGREPAAIAQAVALTFMGERIEKWPEARRAGTTAFFSHIVYKKTNEWKEEIVCMDPAPMDAFEAEFPDGIRVKIQSGEDPRRVFAVWLIAKDNPWFARNIVNRIWFWLLGRGIIHEPDDIRADNPPSNPKLLAFLEKELVNANFDLRHIYRLILNSRTYQQSSIPRSAGPEAEALFACYPVRRLDAEVLVDAFRWISGARMGYSSQIPEPFAFVPDYQRTIALADGSTTSPVLEMFGRPARDTGLESERNNQPTESQRLHLLNSSDIQNGIARSPRLRGMLDTMRGNRRDLIRYTYLGILSRFPTTEEQSVAEKYFRAGMPNPKQAHEDLVWALINGKEFLYRH